MARHPRRVVILGAGMGGLAAAIELAVRGVEVELFERAPAPGGKVHEITVGGWRCDAGPRWIAMRDVFDALFADAGATLSERLTLSPAPLLARHVWSETEVLDLAADPAEAADAIGRFAGAAGAAGFRGFLRRAAEMHAVLDAPVIRGQRPTPLGLIAKAGLGRLLGLSPFATLWDALGEHFADPRLRQVFARCATNLGMSPLRAPATLMLLGHVEMQGVWRVAGGLQRLPEAMAALAVERGARLHFGAAASEILTEGGRASGARLASGEAVAGDAVIANCEPEALAGGVLGEAAARAVPAVQPARSFSAVTWAFCGRAAGVPLGPATSILPADARAEHAELGFRGRMPAVSTLHIAAPAREGAAPDGEEPLLFTLLAPARRDSVADPARVARDALAQAGRAGLHIEPPAGDWPVAGPAEHARRFPGSHGALWGSALQGAMSLFDRPGAATRLPGLFLAGAGVHPGPGLAMAALSGRHAAAAVLEERR